MGNLDLFKYELDNVSQSSLIKQIIKNETAVKELYNQAYYSKERVPNLTRYTERLELDENGRFRNEKEFYSLQREFYNNFKNIDKEYHFFNISSMPTLKSILKFEQLVNNLEKTKTIEIPEFNKDANFDEINGLFSKFSTTIQEISLDWLNDYDEIKVVSDVVAIVTGTEKEDMTRVVELRKSLINYLKTQTKVSISKEYDGVAYKLSKYISCTNDRVLEHIITKHELLSGADKPEWIGNAADAHRLRDWCDMTEAEMKKCFDGDVIKKLRRGSFSGIKPKMTGTIWDELEKLPKQKFSK